MDVGEARVGLLVLIQRLEEIAAVVLPVLIDEGLQAGAGAGLQRDEGLEALAAFEPAGGAEVGAGVAVELLFVAGAGAEQERDAIVGARDDDGDGAGLEAVEAIAAEGVAEQDGVVFVRGHGIDAGLDLVAHGGAGTVVEALAEEFGVDGMRRAGEGVSAFAIEDFASNELQAHRRISSTRARM